MRPGRRPSMPRTPVVLTVAIAMVLVSPAAFGAGGQLPPKVKPSAAKAGHFRFPSGVTTVPRGAATRLGFCGGDDWEPEIATDGGSYVYVVLAHYPGNPTCDPSSANPNRVYIQVSSDGGKAW